MKQLCLLISVFLCAVSLLAFSAAPARAQDEEPQTITDFGDKLCGYFTNYPADVIHTLPIRYFVRIALAQDLGSEDAYYTYLEEVGITSDEFIDSAIESGEIIDENTGIEYFGEEPYTTCYYEEPEVVNCEEMFEVIADTGLMGGALPVSYDSLHNAAAEQGVQACGTLTIFDGFSSFNMGLIMIDNLWYFATFWAPE